jgi:hypothetical protein
VSGDSSSRSQRASVVFAVLGIALSALSAPAEAAPTAPRGEPGSRLGASGTSTEYWDLVASLDSGHRVFARFSITNEGPGKRTAYALGHVVTPKGVAYQFQNGRKEGEWELRDDGHTLDIGSSELYLSGPERRLWIRREKLGVVLDLHFTPPALGSPQDPGLPGYSVDLLHAATPVEGSLQLLKEMREPIPVRGVIASTHTWMEHSETEFAVRRVDFFSLPLDPAQDAVYLSSVTTPKGARAQRLAIESRGRVRQEAVRVEVGFGPASGLAKRPGYGIPSRIDFSASGIGGNLTMKRLLLENDPMGVIPQPFRWLMSLESQPHRVWIEAPFEVRVARAPEGKPQVLRGTGVAAFNFLKPLPAEVETNKRVAAP